MLELLSPKGDGMSRVDTVEGGTGCADYMWQVRKKEGLRTRIEPFVKN